ncbi:u9-Nephitoxin-Nsp1a_1 [Trichonephila clavipes]|uniref:U9-Nephitoxin-Nsp1a_1 n=1 Tax=Trichonephila clavipes TaxID=2585209 RepID=A0A8X6W8U1_TRICX|nr:u9-Nephitoxin-Nsp1a_1 [Trichonephila clavipes]
MTFRKKTMHSIAIICLAVFVTVVTWTNAVKVNEINAMKKDFCENKQLGDNMQKCFEKLEKIDLPKEIPRAIKTPIQTIPFSISGTPQSHLKVESHIFLKYRALLH